MEILQSLHVENCGVVFQNTEPGFAHDESNTCQACLAAGREPDIQGTRIVKPEVFRPRDDSVSGWTPTRRKEGHSQVNQNDIEMKAKDDDDESGSSELRRPQQNYQLH